MLSERWSREAQARSKNGQPAHSTTGVPNANWIHIDAAGDTNRCRCSGSRWSPISRTSMGAASTAAITNRRVMSRSSGLAPLSSVLFVSSSAMPQIGQAPDSVRLICGCMGQVYAAAAGLPAASVIDSELTSPVRGGMVRRSSNRISRFPGLRSKRFSRPSVSIRVPSPLSIGGYRRRPRSEGRRRDVGQANFLNRRLMSRAALASNWR